MQFFQTISNQCITFNGNDYIYSIVGSSCQRFEDLNAGATPISRVKTVNQNISKSFPKTNRICNFQHIPSKLMVGR